MAAIVESPVSHHFEPNDVQDKSLKRHSGSDKTIDLSARQLRRNDSIPSQTELENCKDMTVYNSVGEAFPFSSLYSDTSRRTLIIFVRHFFCGMCQDFLKHLSSYISPRELESLSTPTSIIIVGCGSPDLINDYAANTHCEFPIYADPGRKLYGNFGMPTTLAMGPTRPDYQTSKMVHMVVRSIYQGLSSGTGAMKGGSFTQVGGEFLFENGTVTWCHKMRDTRDHTEVSELRTVLGLDSI